MLPKKVEDTAAAGATMPARRRVTLNAAKNRPLEDSWLCSVSHRLGGFCQSFELRDTSPDFSPENCKRLPLSGISIFGRKTSAEEGGQPFAYTV